MKICFVCSGNACRSPFAETVLKKMLADKGIENVEVCSVGTLNLNHAERDPEMVRIAAEFGYDMEGTTTYMGEVDYSDVDIILTMSKLHRDKLTCEVPYAKWSCIMPFCEYAGLEYDEVPDPHYQTDTVYRKAASMIIEGCEKIICRIAGLTTPIKAIGDFDCGKSSGIVNELCKDILKDI